MDEAARPALAGFIENLGFDPKSCLAAAHYGVLFNRCGKTIYDDLIQDCAHRKDYAEVIRIKRASELSGYDSPVIKEFLELALAETEIIHFLPSAPSLDRKGFAVTHRYLLHGYRYAAETHCSVEKWNPEKGNSAFLECFRANENRGFLGCDPSTGEIYTPYFRYYDENMETLDTFLLFDELLVNITGNIGTNFDSEIHIWETINDTHWTGDHYFYKPSVPVYECETGFFLLSAKLNNTMRFKLPYFDRSLTDLYSRLLKDQWESPNWRDFVSRHADTNEQKRLNNTLITFMVLHTYYKIMPPASQAAFRELLVGGSAKAWEGLVYQSGLYLGRQFRRNDTYGATEADDHATALGAMLLFLQGVVPDTGSLAIPLIEEKYEDEIGGLISSHFSFNAEKHQARIPAWSGSIAFQFGQGVATAEFPEDGIYLIKLADNWNSVDAIEKIDDLLINTYRYII